MSADIIAILQDLACVIVGFILGMFYAMAHLSKEDDIGLDDDLDEYAELISHDENSNTVHIPDPSLFQCELSKKIGGLYEPLIQGNELNGTIEDRYKRQ